MIAKLERTQSMHNKTKTKTDAHNQWEAHQATDQQQQNHPLRTEAAQATGGLCLFIAAFWSPEGKGLTSWLLFEMVIVILLLSHLVSWDRCGTWLYPFLILAVFLTLNAFYWYQIFALYSIAVKTQTCLAHLA